MNLRQKLSFHYLQGEGIEIGALHRALTLPPSARVRYVDRLDTEALRRHYPELQDFTLAPVHIIDDGEQLLSLEDESLDFLIANHMLEHCENPLGTLRTHFRKLKPGGIAYYAIPNKDYTFDQKRALTPFEHLVQDDRLGPLHSREGHYRDILHHTADIPEAAMDQQVKHFMDSGYSIHFHVWDYRSLYAFLLHADAYLGNIFTVEEYRRNGEEILCVLRKTPDAALAHKLAGLAQRAPRVDKALPTTGIAKRWLDARHFLNRVYAKLHAFRYYAEVRKRATLRLRRRLNRLIFQA